MKTLVVAVTILVYQTMAASESNHLVSKALNEFANKLYKEVTGKSGDVAVAPFILHEALTQLLQDARGKTSTELAAVLGFGGSGTGTNLQWQEEYRSWLKKLQGGGLDMTSKFFPVSNSLVEDVTGNISDIKHLKEWVYQNIRRRGKNNLVLYSAVATGLIANQTALLMANFVTFNSTWRTPFSKVVKSQFHPSPQESVDATFMLCEDEFDFKHDAVLEAKVLKMDYTSEDYSMVFVLPDREDGLHALEDKLTQTDLRTLTYDLYKTNLNVTVPKFRARVDLALKGILKRMGISELFDNSTLQGVPSENIYVGDIRQFTEVSIFTETYNLTRPYENVSFPESEERAKEQFVADRPFLFFLMHQDTVLARGRPRE